MEINQFKKLEESIKEESFSKEYKNINTVMFALSIFGHISSIFLAYFLLSKILSGAISNNPALVLISSIILLSGLELLKRDIFQKFSSQSIRLKTIAHKSLYPLMIMSFVIVSVSFYATISGAKDFSSKSEEIEKVAEKKTSTYIDSLSNVYNLKIQDTERESKLSKSKLDQKDAEQTSLESVQGLTSQQRNRIRDLKAEKEMIRSDISKLDTNVSILKNELNLKIKDFESKVTEDSHKKKNENKTNSFLFVIISTVIELIILAGVYFNRYYKIRSYNEFKQKIDRDPNYQKWILYNTIIDIIYNTDTKINDRSPSSKSIIELCRLSGNNLLQKDVADFIKVVSSLGILRTSGSAKYFAKSRETAKEIIKDHFMK